MRGRAVAEYMFLLRGDPRSDSCAGPDNEEAFRRMVQWTETLRDRKKLAGVAPLGRTHARTVYPAGDPLEVRRRAVHGRQGSGGRLLQRRSQDSGGSRVVGTRMPETAVPARRNRDPRGQRLPDRVLEVKRRLK